MKNYTEKQIVDWFVWMEKKYPNSKMREALEEVEMAFFGDGVFEDSIDAFIENKGE